MNDSTPKGWENLDVVVAGYIGIAIGTVAGYFASWWQAAAIVNLSIVAAMFLIHSAADNDAADPTHA